MIAKINKIKYILLFLFFYLDHMYLNFVIQLKLYQDHISYSYYLSSLVVLVDVVVVNVFSAAVTVSSRAVAFPLFAVQTSTLRSTVKQALCGQHREMLCIYHGETSITDVIFID